MKRMLAGWVTILLTMTAYGDRVRANEWHPPDAIPTVIGHFGPAYPEHIPVDIAADGLGNVFVLDLLHQVVRVYDQNGRMLRSMDVGTSQGIKNSRSFTVDPAGNMYVGDTDTSGTSTVEGNARIVKFDSHGNKLGEWAFSARGMGNNGRLLVAASKYRDQIGVFDLNGTLLNVVGAKSVTREPDDAAIASDGTIFSTDSFKRVRIFGSDGRLVRTYDKSSGFDFGRPAGLALDGSGYLFVLDREKAEIVKISPNGQLVGRAGALGHGDGLFVEPHGIVVDTFGNVWVANYHGHNIQKFDNNLNHKLTITGDDTAMGEFAVTHGAGVDSSGNVYIADMWNNRVSKFDNRGSFITAWGRRGYGDGAVFNFPRFLSVDKNDNVYVASDGDIRKFDRHGNYLARWGEPTVSETTCGFARCSRGMAFDEEGNIYFTRVHEHRIVRIDVNSGVIRYIGSAGTDPGRLKQPWGIAIRGDRMYVAEYGNHRVQILSLSGQFIGQFGDRGSGDGQMIKPTALALDREGRIYVGDSGNGRVQVFDPGGAYLGKWGSAGSGLGQFSEIHAIAVDHVGNVFTSDWKNTVVQRFGRAQVPLIGSRVNGRPEVTWGVDRGAYLWRQGGDRDWRLRLSASREEVIKAVVVIDKEPTNVELVGISHDSATRHQYGFEVVANGNEHEQGVNFNVPDGASVAVAVTVNGEYNPGMLRVGRDAVSPNPTGWVVSRSNTPELPPFQRRSSAGIFFGRTGGGVELSISSGDERLRAHVRVMTSLPLDETVTLSVDSNDSLAIGRNSVSLLGGGIRDYDGVRAGLKDANTLIYFEFSVDELMRPWLHNSSSNPSSFGLGVPNAVVLRNR